MRSLCLAFALALVCASAASAQPSVRPASPFFAATPRVNTSVVLRDRPGGHVLASLGTETQFGSPETVGVAVERGNSVGVITTQLPNGVLGWVPRKELTLMAVDWSIDISLSQHVLVLRHDGKVVRRARIAIGAPGSPTPTGRYVITDHIDPGAQSATYRSASWPCPAISRTRQRAGAAVRTGASRSTAAAASARPSRPAASTRTRRRFDC